ncbi:MAG: type II toxin-antitoxin system VapC family toxin [Candidatus Omnitrophica bacterium]|nr:type II toxin-antitoxin system VapC family toxin [Candidatus Omnitrophota bacterium]
MRVFVDTGAWLAFYDRHDQHHESARQIVGQLKAQRANLVLSELILAESLTLIRYRLGHSWAIRFGEAILESHLAELIDMGEPLRRRAWDIFQRYADKDFSFTDCARRATLGSNSSAASIDTSPDDVLW